MRDLARVLGKFETVKVARPRKGDLKLFSDSSRIPSKQSDPIREANCLPDIVGNEDNRLTAFLPDLLDVAVKLFTRERVQRRERFIHKQNSRIRSKCPSQGNSLFHPTGKLVNMRSRKFFQTDELEKKFRYF